MNDARAGLFCTDETGFERFVIVRADNRYLCAALANAIDLDRRRDRGDEDLGDLSQALGREGDGHPMIATRGSVDPGGWDSFGKQIVERSTRLEGTGVLQQFEFQHDVRFNQSRVPTEHDDRRLANVRFDPFVSALNRLASNAGRWSFHRKLL